MSHMYSVPPMRCFPLNNRQEKSKSQNKAGTIGRDRLRRNQQAASSPEPEASEDNSQVAKVQKVGPPPDLRVGSSPHQQPRHRNPTHSGKGNWSTACGREALSVSHFEERLEAWKTRDVAIIKQSAKKDTEKGLCALVIKRWVSELNGKTVCSGDSGSASD